MSLKDSIMASLPFKKSVYCPVHWCALQASAVVCAFAFALAPFPVRFRRVASAAANTLPGLWAFRFRFGIEGGVGCSDLQLANLRVLLEELVVWNGFADVEKALLLAESHDFAVHSIVAVWAFQLETEFPHLDTELNNFLFVFCFYIGDLVGATGLAGSVGRVVFHFPPIFNNVNHYFTLNYVAARK